MNHRNNMNQIGKRVLLLQHLPQLKKKEVQGQLQLKLKEPSSFIIKAIMQGVDLDLPDIFICRISAFLNAPVHSLGLPLMCGPACGSTSWLSFRLLQGTIQEVPLADTSHLCQACTHSSGARALSWVPVPAYVHIWTGRRVFSGWGWAGQEVFRPREEGGAWMQPLGLIQAPVPGMPNPDPPK